MICDTTSVATV